MMLTLISIWLIGAISLFILLLFIYKEWEYYNFTIIDAVFCALSWHLVVIGVVLIIFTLGDKNNVG